MVIGQSRAIKRQPRSVHQLFQQAAQRSAGSGLRKQGGKAGVQWPWPAGIQTQSQHRAVQRLVLQAPQAQIEPAGGVMGWPGPAHQQGVPFAIVQTQMPAYRQHLLLIAPQVLLHLLKQRRHGDFEQGLVVYRIIELLLFPEWCWGGNRPAHVRFLSEQALQPVQKGSAESFAERGPRQCEQVAEGMKARGPQTFFHGVFQGQGVDRQGRQPGLEPAAFRQVDVLALGMLTAIRKTLDLVSHYRGRPLIMQDIPTEDPATYDMLCKGNSLGVFQVESRAQMNMLPRLRPRKFYDLVIEVAIVRPGPIQGDMVHPYLRRRDGLEEPDYPDPKVEAVLKRTLGIPIFQEQVIQLVMVAAKFSGGEADQLRRAMARWGKSGELMQFQDKVIQGMRANGYSEDYAQRLFEQMKGFGGYGFPESHSASFALLVYVSAWLKRHHTSAFYCGLLNSLPMGFYSPSQILQDARRHAIELRPLDVRHSHWDHTLEETQRQKLGVQPALRLGFRQLKGFNPEAAERLVQARAERPFSSVRDLCQRARLNQREREALVAGNALRALSGHRHQGHWEIQGLEAPRPLLETERGAGKDHDGVYLDAPSEHADLLQDYRHLGLTLGRHPMALVRHLPRFRGCRRARDLKRGRPGQLIRVAGLVTNRQRPGSAKGALFMTLEDETGNTNVVIWNAIQERFRKTLLRSPLVIVKGTLEISPEGIVHLMAGALIDAGDALRELNIKSRDFR